MTTDSTSGYPQAGSEYVYGTTPESTNPPAQVGQTVKEKGAQVATTAVDEAAAVADETKDQARNLLHQTQAQVREQAATQKDRATGGLRTLADELRTMSGRTSPGDQRGMAGDLAREAADKVHAVANWLESREPGDLLEEIRGLARRKPGSFLLGAAAAGVLAGRLTRGAVEAKRENEGANSDGATPTGSAATIHPHATAAAGTERSGDATEVVAVDTSPLVATDAFPASGEHTFAGGERR